MGNSNSMSAEEIATREKYDLKNSNYRNVKETHIADGLYSVDWLECFWINDRLLELQIKLNSHRYKIGNAKYPDVCFPVTSVYDENRIIIGYSRDEASEKLKSKAIDQGYQRNFYGAKKLFNQAYLTCEEGYIKKAEFAAARDAMSLAIEGKDHLNAEQYAAAENKFKAAQNMAGASDIKYLMMSYVYSAQEKWAENYHKQGMNAARTGDFASAKEHFNNAYNKSPSEISKFADNREVMNLAIKGQNYINKGQFEAAENMFKTAQNKAATSDIKNQMQTLADSARNKWAEKYFTQGVNAAKNGDFASAKEHFNNAYNKCTSDYVNEASFEANRNAMNLAIEGQNYTNKGKYNEAENMFKAAQNKATTSDIKNRMQTLADSAGNKLAEKYYTQGVNAARTGDFASARGHFNNAYKKCTSDYTKKETKFAANRDAMDSAIEGKRKYDLEQYEVAERKFREAQNKATTSEIKNQMKILTDSAKSAGAKMAANNLAENYFTQGVNAAKNGDFASAKEHFNNAYNKCTSDYVNEASFEANRNAMNLAIDGQNYINKGKYNEAENMFKAAQNKATTSDIKNRMQTLADSAGNKLAEKYYTQGVNAAKTGNFVSAKENFSDAYNKCTSGYANEAAFQAYRDAMISAIEGQKLFKAGQFKSAESKFKEAMDKARTSDIKNRMNTLAESARNALAEEYLTGGDFTSAKELFDDAYRRTTLDHEKAMFAANRDAMDLAIEGQNNLKSKQYGAAEYKFKKAKNSMTPNIQNIMQTFVDSVSNKIAENDYRLGMIFARNGDFLSARTYFDNAYQKCTSSYSNRAKFAANRDAMNLAIEALRLFNLDKFEEGQQKLKTAMAKFIDTKKEFISQVESKTAKMLENAIKRRNDLVTKQINGLWSGFFEAEKAGDHNRANKLLSEVESALKKSANYESLGSEYQKLKQMYDLHKKGYQLYDEANKFDLDKLDESLDLLEKSEAVFEEAVKIDKRFEHELEVVRKSRKDTLAMIDDMKQNLEELQNMENEENMDEIVYTLHISNQI